jgi:hypothetical protein
MLDLLWAVAAICVVLRSFLGALHLRHHAFYLTRDLVCLAVALELLVARQVARSLLDLAFCLWRRRWTGSASDTRGRRPVMLISEVGNVAGRQHQPSKASRAVQAALRDARSIARRHSLRVRRRATFFVASAAIIACGITPQTSRETRWLRHEAQKPTVTGRVRGVGAPRGSSPQKADARRYSSFANGRRRRPGHKKPRSTTTCGGERL